MTTIGYIRVSTDDQDVDKQRHLLLDYSQKHKILIDQFIDVEISSRQSQEARRLSEVKALLKSGDLLLVAELSRLGRNMLETLNLIHDFTENGVQIIFIRQPELSTTGSQTKLLMAIYSYFAEAECDFISIRTNREQVGSCEMSQDRGINFVGLDFGSSNRPYLLGMSQDNRFNMRLKDIVHVAPVASRFHDR